jgi:hypothetical protein
MQKFYRLGLFLCSLGLVLTPACQPRVVYAADFLLEWDANTEQDLQGYYVYYREGATVSADLAGATKETVALDTPGFDADHPGFTFTGLKDETLYYFAVSAFSAAGESPLSGEVSLSKGQDDNNEDPSGGSGDPEGSADSGGSGDSGDSEDTGGSGGCFIGTAQWFQLRDRFTLGH